MSTDLWIWIPNWDGADGFQHYKDRDPIWIKNYTRLLSHDAYMELTLTQRGILHGVWLEYARSHHRLPSDTLRLSRRLGQRIYTRDIEALNQAGFIQLVASDTLARLLAERYPSRAPARSREAEEERALQGSLSSNRSYTSQPPASALNGATPAEWQPKNPKMYAAAERWVRTDGHRLIGPNLTKRLLDDFGMNTDPDALQRLAELGNELRNEQPPAIIA